MGRALGAAGLHACTVRCGILMSMQDEIRRTANEDRPVSALLVYLARALWALLRRRKKEDACRFSV